MVATGTESTMTTQPATSLLRSADTINMTTMIIVITITATTTTTTTTTNDHNDKTHEVFTLLDLLVSAPRARRLRAEEHW